MWRSSRRTDAHFIWVGTGPLVPNGNNAAFIQAAVEVATDARRRAMGISARRAVQPLRPELVARDFVGVLATLTV